MNKIKYASNYRDRVYPPYIVNVLLLFCWCQNCWKLILTKHLSWRFIILRTWITCVIFSSHTNLFSIRCLHYLEWHWPLFDYLEHMSSLILVHFLFQVVDIGPKILRRCWNIVPKCHNRLLTLLYFFFFWRNSLMTTIVEIYLSKIIVEIYIVNNFLFFIF